MANLTGILPYKDDTNKKETDETQNKEDEKKEDDDKDEYDTVESTGDFWWSTIN